ncbi:MULTISPECIES: D-serine ammonia-lyase [unclassified Brevibacterium]|uniref:D-serine ammonia-lyase n=1 Tax=unclassified Brevibacterium TaxID=2614124 RepID=UPI00109237CB|nr:D-serine ammonia-lyase [Brevibacterium sp. S22]TGD32549.1 D-serine ammonia-lyase [Brevibacterium sp. S22]
MTELSDELSTDEIIRSLAAGRPTTWLRSSLAEAALPALADIMDSASARFDRFAPWFAETFPETATVPAALAAEFPEAAGGMIESALVPAPAAQRRLDGLFGSDLVGQLWLKRDDSLPVSGSIKARGGFHEVLEFAEAVAAEHGLDAYDPATYSSPQFREIAANHRIVVGSTGNLGLSIGILGARLGFAASVHMSADARDWKKTMLRDHGVDVIEHSGDFVEAVEVGRTSAEAAENTHFVDDEDSVSLFAGYSVAALRLRRQFDAAGVTIDEQNPLTVYLPCGIGGGPGGVTFGLKRVFGAAVRCVFVEPSQAPAMFVGVRTGRHSDISVQDIGLSGATAADGLAVARPSRFIGPTIGPLISGFASVPDEVIRAGVGVLHETEGIDVEPSATAGLTIPWRMGDAAAEASAGVHLVWLTGGAMVPDAEREAYVDEGRGLVGSIGGAASAIFVD